MKQLVLGGCIGLFGLLRVWAVDPIFINDSPINSPPDNAPVIDAYAWVNRAPFSVVTLSGFGLPVPFESPHTLFFTNLNFMSGNPGYRFYNNVGTQRLSMDTWTNNGTIATDTSLIFPVTGGAVFGTNIFFGFNSLRSILQVQANNIASTGSGTLRSGAQGLIHLEGKKVNLKRNGLRTGEPPNVFDIFFGGGFLLSSNYVNDFGIFDLYWGSGTNNMLNGRGPGMRIDGTFPTFDLPRPVSPSHEVIELFNGFQLQTFSQLPRFAFLNTNSFNSTNYTAAVWTNAISPSNLVVQVVFYPTNTLDTNFTTDVTFLPAANGASLVVVGFHSVDFDIVDQANRGSSVYLSDALATTTNVYLARNQAFNTRRPDTYEVSRIPPFGIIGGGFGFFPNSGSPPFTNTLLWQPSYALRVVTNLYAAYDAQVASVTTAAGLAGDPTNYPGRVEIISEELDLDKTRIRAESSLSIKVTKNLTSNILAGVDAPFISFDAASLAPQLVISNLAPANVRRFSGDIAAWSATWTNYNLITNIDTSTGTAITNVTTNTIFFHVLIVDPNIQTITPVTVWEFAGHANNLVICDKLAIGKSFIADSVGLDIKGGVTHAFSGSWGATNLPRLLNFTNEGTVQVFRVANHGMDRGNPYNNYINRGTNRAGTLFVRTDNFDNSGSLIADGGLLQVQTITARLISTKPLTYFTDTNEFALARVVTNDFGAHIQGNSDVQITANDMVMSNALILARGSLFVSVANRLVDSGQVGTNYWRTSGGVNLVTRPVTTDLMGTQIFLDALGFAQESFNIWSGQDIGANTAGYNNNLAVSKLVLDGSPNSVFHFAPPEGQTGKAIYVDYLALTNYATNYNIALDISPDFNIYFANSSVNPEKLDHSESGRLHWVQDFKGPLSSTNIVVTNSVGEVLTNYVMNVALAQSLELDSDNDGTVNGKDPDPLGMVPAMTIATTKTVPQKAVISWYSRANATNRIEYRTSPLSTNWTRLTNIVSGSTNGVLKVQDTVPTNAMRLYRLRVDPRRP